MKKPAVKKLYLFYVIWHEIDANEAVLIDVIAAPGIWPSVRAQNRSFIPRHFILLDCRRTFRSRNEIHGTRHYYHYTTSVIIILRPLLFNVRSKIIYCNFLLFAGDKNFCRITFVHEYLLLQSDVGLHSVKNWGTARYTKLNAGETRVISSSRKSNMLTQLFPSWLWDPRTDSAH
jgi:hypothetical protein